MRKWLSIALLIIIADQLSKYIAEATLQFQIPVYVMPSFNWFLAYNTGAAFSFLGDAGGWQRWFFIGLAVFVSIVLTVWLSKLKPAQNWEGVSLALILGGAIGNLIDRIYLGHVIDFIQLYYDRFYWPAFNVADSAICVGAGMLIWDGVMGLRKAGETGTQS